MNYYDRIAHNNTSDVETTIYEKISKEEEKYRIKELRIYRETNAGIGRIYVEREQIGVIPTSMSTISNFLRYEYDIDLRVGESFKITLQNVTAGTNAT